MVDNKIEVKCKKCGKEFLRYKCHIQKNNFCSRKCSDTFHTKENHFRYNSINKTCIICSKIFSIRKSLSNAKYCSNECKIQGMRARTVLHEVVCTYCNKHFKIIPSRFKGKSRFYCTRSCADKSRSIQAKERNSILFAQLALQDKKVEIIRRKNISIGWENTSEEIKNRKRNSVSKQMSGKNHHNWLGGKSFEPYGLEFNNKLKEQIRTRDKHICQECHHTENQLGYKLHIHHIDYNKKNNHPSNLISLCRSCHCQTNFKRGDWTDYLKSKIKVDA